VVGLAKKIYNNYNNHNQKAKTKTKKKSLRRFRGDRKCKFRPGTPLLVQYNVLFHFFSFFAGLLQSPPLFIHFSFLLNHLKTFLILKWEEEYTGDCCEVIHGCGMLTGIIRVTTHLEYKVHNDITHLSGKTINIKSS